MRYASKEVLYAACRNDFETFGEMVFAHLRRGEKYVPSWHISAMAYALTEVAEGRCRRLILNLPPRHLKSILASVALPAWILGRDPTHSIICVSYSEDLGTKHSRDCREIMESYWYKAIFPNTRLSRRKKTETELTTTRNGSRLTTSIGGTLTGRGADYLIIDDPLKAADANSDAARNSVNEWYASTALNRLNDQAKGAVIIAMHRLHEDDLVGHVTERSTFQILSLPAIAEEDARIPIGHDRFHIRRVGDVLSPARQKPETLEKTRQEIGSGAFSAQYQQAPMPADGNVIHTKWLKTYKEAPPLSELRIVHSWDIAMTNRDTSDWTVGTIWGTKGDLHYLLDVIRGRWEMPDVRRKILAAAEARRPDAVLIEEAGIGMSLLQDLRREGSGINFIGRKPDKDKMTRVVSTQSTFEAGRVLLPEDAPWLGEYKRELLGFPAMRHDDQTDSTAQFINWMRDNHSVVVIPFVLPDFYEPSKWQIGDESLLDRPSWWGRELQR